MSNRQNNLFALTLFGLSIFTLLAFQGQLPAIVNNLTQQFSSSMLEPSYLNQPLAMTGGDPYIRALMRTITASESNVAKSYYVLYGGKYVDDLSKHPEQCMPILTGPNIGQCSTAAGRYQFLNTTWYEKARQYHPKPSGVLWWKNYSFEPEYQDKVVYAWLNDKSVWGVNISQKLQQGKIEAVLKLLSPTWTSLGYGIETNSMSPHLSRIYQKMLTEELKRVG
jgi:muramidase (phage lysozyme)